MGCGTTVGPPQETVALETVDVSSDAHFGNVENGRDALLEEIVDRFGKLPAQAQTLIDVHRLRVCHNLEDL